ncbi:MAG: PQQ-like beta-propeller repeat protein [Candidatus Doudnabacteria bacterium]|nr:PQQ-like beta-propeller repeat protein [Candidatus Doudnabacteria bacterium]
MFRKFSVLIGLCAAIAGGYVVFSSADTDSPAIAAAQTANTDWPQFQHDAQNSGYQPNMDIPTNKHRSTGGYGNPTWQYTFSEKSQSQPVVVGGIVAVGTVTGKVYAFRLSDGNINWTADAGNSVPGTLAITDNKVIAATFDGKVIAFNITNGAVVWTSAQAKGPFSGSPKVANGLIYLGSEDGVFHAIRVSDGTTAWTFTVGSGTDSGSEPTPIYTTAAVLGNKVFFGAENMQVYALDAGTGNLLWKRKVYGQSFNHNSLVTSSQNGGVVIARTQPIYNFHAQLSSDDDFIKNATGKTWQGNPLGNFAEWVVEQKAISQRLASNPHRRSSWELDVNTGNDKFSQPLPIIYTYAHGDVPDSPIVDDVNNRAWVFGRSIYARFDSGSTVRQYADPLKINLSFNPNVYTNSSLGEAALGFNYFPCAGTRDCQIEYEEFHKVGDEASTLSAARNALLVSTWVAYGGLDLSTGASFSIRYYGSDDTTEALPRGEATAVIANGFVITRDTVGIKAYKVN